MNGTRVQEPRSIRPDVNKCRQDLWFEAAGLTPEFTARQDYRAVFAMA